MSKKIEQKLIKTLIYSVRKNYNLVMRKEIALGLIRQFINVYRQNTELNHAKEHFIDKTFYKYWATTKLPVKEKKRHSAFWYKCFLKKNYVFIVLPKNKITKLLLKLIT